MKLLIIEVAALGYECWDQLKQAEFWKKLNSQKIGTVFPAVTCTVQASFRTALPPSGHGMISNGFFDREMKKPFFWEQASTLYQGERIWEDFRKAGNTVGQICWQQAIGIDSDLILTPAPIHKHHGGMIQDFYARPKGLYHKLCKKTGKTFNLHSYWGPFTSFSSTEWIANAGLELLKSGNASDLQLIYLPHLDYEMQKTGPGSKATAREFAKLENSIERLFVAAKLAGYEVVIFGDYAINNAKEVILPNKILRDANLFSLREVKGALYPDIYSSKAFAMVDHQIAHVYIPDKNDIESVANSLKPISGIKNVFSHEKIDHPRSGELILEADEGYWFAYPWWDKKSEAPDYATHVDIHNKPGFDPCELFLAFWPPMSISMDTSKIQGTHGASGHDILWASTFKFDSVSNIIEAAKALKKEL
jgi:predicted AlkP superfamily pyrophosphatase or phosphodiesterase